MFRISGVGFSEKITEYKTAKQALIAAATHVAVVERQQMGVWLDYDPHVTMCLPKTNACCGAERHRTTGP